MSNNLNIAAAEVNVPYANHHPARGARTTTGINPYTGTWGKQEVVHLLKRTLFGAKRDDITYFMGKSMSQSVDELLTPAASPLPPVNAYTAQYNDPNVPYGQTWVNAAADPLAVFGRAVSLKSWWSGLMINQGRSITEKMTLFWHNHFSTQITIYAEPRFGYKHLKTLRDNSLGNIKTLTKAITLDPAMLVYLNGTYNTNTAPDENYGRELQELFTVGKGAGAQFTEDDVKAAARVLTGFRADQTNNTYYFDPPAHDTNDKSFSSFYSNKLITGKSGANGANELDELLAMIFDTNEVALYICRRLYRFFVYYDIDASVETNVIVPLANVLRSNNYDITPVLSTLFKSEHFFDVLNRSCFIKPPVDFLVSILREFDVKIPAANVDLDAQYYFWSLVEYYGIAMQQDLLDPPNVSGWPAYYQEPSYHELWINTSTLPLRNQITDYLLYSGPTKNSSTLFIDIIDYVSKLTNPSDPVSLLDEALGQIYTIDISQASKDYLRIYGLLGGQAQNYYWTNAWNDYVANPTDAAKKAIVKNKLFVTFKYLLDFAEYQLS